MLDNKTIQLTASEFELLWLLASMVDEVLSRKCLVKAIRTIDYKIMTLRKKLGDPPFFAKENNYCEKQEVSVYGRSLVN